MRLPKTGILLTLSALIAVHAYASIKIPSVMLNQPDAKNLIDGNKAIFTKFKPGENTFSLQMGALKDIGSIKIYFSKVTEFKSFKLQISDDFISWNTAAEYKNIKTDLIDVKAENISALFVRIILESVSEYAIGEIECYEKASGKNEIYDVKISGISDNSVVVTWKTKIKSQDHFHYQKKYNGTKETLIEVNYITDHSVTLSGLLKGSDYIFIILSESPDGTRVESKQFAFKTTGVPLPEFWQLNAKNITPFTAKLFYESNIPTSYELFFGQSHAAMKKIKDDQGLAVSRDIDISGLQQETGYFYQLYLKDAQGNVIKTPQLAFSTPPNNIALGKKVWGTFNYVDPTIKELGYGETSIDKLTDGSLNYFGGMAISFNADNSDQYAVVDLGSVSAVKRLDIYWWALSFSKDYRIDVSIDGKSWTTLKEHLDASQGTDMRSPMGDYVVLHSIPLDTSARFIRVYIAAKAPRGTREKKWKPWKNLFLCEIAVIAK
jgi:hypothetical protein